MSTVETETESERRQDRLSNPGPGEPAGDNASAAAERARDDVDRRRRAYWIVGIAAAGLLFGLLGIGVLVERLTFYGPTAALNQRLEEEGAPVTWEDARQAAPHPPAELDGTEAWTAFLEQRLPVTPYDRLAPDASEGHAAVWLDDLRALAESGTYRVARYPTSDVVKSDYMVSLPGIDAENGLARFLVDRAQKLQEDGDVDGAAESLALSLPLAANAKFEPFLVCRLSGVARLKDSLEGVESLLRDAGVSPARLEQLQKALSRCDIETDLESMRLHELLIQRDYALDGRLTDAQLNPFERWAARRILVRQLDLVDRVRKAEALPPAERLAELAAVDEIYRRNAEEEGAYAPTKVSEFAHLEFRSNNVRHALLFAETANRRRALIAALASRRYESEWGRLPDDWSDLAAFGVDDPPTNAWTEAPMTLTRKPDGSVTIGAPWIPEALEARSLLEDEASGEPYQGITLEPKAD